MGQISLRTLDKNAQKKKQRERQANEGNRNRGNNAPRQVGREMPKQISKEAPKQINKEITKEGPPKKNISISSASPKPADQPRKIIRPIKDNKTDQQPGE